MNKEVIKANKACFDYWLDGGKILFLWANSNNSKWIEADTHHEWRWSDNIYIKNDKYADLRKALADGKTIQVDISITTGNSQLEWKDLGGILTFDMCIEGNSTRPPSDFRIKPDEPKFKVGDWVRDKNSKFIIRAYDDMIEPNFELWKPKVGEYIFESEYGLCKVISNTEEEGIEVRECYHTKQLLTTKLGNCEPLVGPLPTALQDV